MQNHSLIIIAISMALSACSQQKLKEDCGVGIRECGDGYDYDGDGYCDDVDCDENDCDINPGAKEVCDGVDNDCDGASDIDAIGPDISDYYMDRDGDGYTTFEKIALCDNYIYHGDFPICYTALGTSRLKDKDGNFCVIGPASTFDGNCDRNPDATYCQEDCCDAGDEDACVIGYVPECVYPLSDGTCDVDDVACPAGHPQR